MRVLHVRQTRKLYGPEKTLLGLCRELARAGHPCEIALIYRSFEGDPAEHPLVPLARADGIEAIQLDGRLRRLPKVLRWLRNRAADPELAVIHAHDYKADLLAMMATRGLRRRPALVATPRHTESARLLRALQWIDRQFLDRYDRLTVPTAAALAEFQESPALLERARVVPHGAEPGSFAPGPALPVAHGPVISLVGRLHEGKGHRYFLQAAAQVSAQVPAARFWLAGEGPLHQELALLIRTLGIQNSVAFLGYRTDVDRVLLASSVVVVASRYESSCRVAMEALHMGRPLVSTAVGVIPELIGDNQGGLLVPSDDPGALAEAILMLLRDVALANRLAASGQAAVQASHSHRAAAEGMAAVYREALVDRA